MNTRKKAAFGISAALLAIGAALTQFGIGIGGLIKLPVMVFHIIVAISLPGTAEDNWWKSTFVVTALAYLLAWCLYAIVVDFILKRCGAFKTPEDLAQPAADKPDEAAADKGSSVWAKLAGYAVTAAFVVLIVRLQGKQEDEFMDKSRLAAVAHCNQDDACLQNLDQNFSACFEANHESHKSGKFNRKHSLDESGFNDCLASYLTAAEPQENADEAHSAAANANAADETATTT